MIRDSEKAIIIVIVSMTKSFNQSNSGIYRILIAQNFKAILANAYEMRKLPHALTLTDEYRDLTRKTLAVVSAMQTKHTHAHTHVSS